MLLKGKAGIVTGAGRGIGRAIAVGLAAEGASVLVNYHRSEREAEEVVSLIRNAGGVAHPFRADVSKKADVEAMVAFTLNVFGKIDFLVNNAGLRIESLVEDMSEEDWDLIMNTNVKSTFLCSQGVIKPMKEQKGGRIVNMTSGRGVVGMVKGAHYAASKAAIMGFTKSLSLELASYGINVNAVAPGPVDTDQWRTGKSREEIEKIRTEQRKMPTLLLKGVLDPADTVGTVLFLLTEGSRAMTGQTVFIRSP